MGLSNLVSERGEPKQLDLFEKGEVRERSWEPVERAMDTIKEKFGRDAIKRGGVIKDPQTHQGSTGPYLRFIELLLSQRLEKRLG